MNASGHPIRSEKQKSQSLPIGYAQSEAAIFAVLGLAGCGALVAAVLWGSSPELRTREPLAAETGEGPIAPAQMHSGQIAAEALPGEPELPLTTNRGGFGISRSNLWTQTNGPSRKPQA